MATGGGSVTEAVIRALREQANHLEQHHFADILIRVQDGKPVVIEITSKHRPRQ